MRPRAIELHIEELVLRGVADVDQHALAQALQREMTSQLAQAVLRVEADCSLDRLAPPPVEVPAHAGTVGLGTALAQALHGALPGGMDAAS